MNWLRTFIVSLWLLPLRALAGPAVSGCTSGGLNAMNTDCIFVGGSGPVSPSLTLSQIFYNIADTLLKTIGGVATALFIVGAFLYIVSLEKEERKNQGKEFMIGSLIGIGIVVGAKGILNTVMYFLFF